MNVLDALSRGSEWPEVAALTRLSQTTAKQHLAIAQARFVPDQTLLDNLRYPTLRRAINEGIVPVTVDPTLADQTLSDLNHIQLFGIHGLSLGHHSEEVSQRLHVSPRTLKRYVSEAYDYFGHYGRRRLEPTIRTMYERGVFRVPAAQPERTRATREAIVAAHLPLL